MEIYQGVEMYNLYLLTVVFIIKCGTKKSIGCFSNSSIRSLPSNCKQWGSYITRRLVCFSFLVEIQRSESSDIRRGEGDFLQLSTGSPLPGFSLILLQATSEIAKQFYKKKHVDPYLHPTDILISHNCHLLFLTNFLIPSFFLSYLFLVQKFGVLMTMMIFLRGRKMKQKKLKYIFVNKLQV